MAYQVSPTTTAQPANGGQYAGYTKTAWTDGSNVRIFYVPETSNTGSAQLPVGSTSQRDTTPIEGSLRYNTTTLSFEGYYNAAWRGMGGATGGSGESAMFENDIVIDNSYTITTGKNAMSAGPITVSVGVTITVPSGSVWSIV